MITFPRIAVLAMMGLVVFAGAVAADPLPPKTDAVASVTAVSDGTGRATYEVVLTGSQFATGADAARNILVFQNEPKIIPACEPTKEPKPSDPRRNCVQVEVWESGKQIAFKGYMGKRGPNEKVAVQRFGAEVPAPGTYIPIAFPVPSGFQNTVQIITALLVAVLGAGGAFVALRCLYLFRSEMVVEQPGGGEKAATWYQVLLIDPKTNTYSLSSFQFAAWSFAFLIAYIYLFIGHVLVQGYTDFVDLPPDFATMLAATSGTAIAAAGIDSGKGSKGAGAIHPALTDLISNGGVFAPERFQFLVWTIVGVVGYLVLTISRPLSTIDGLPQISSGILGLSGVSGLAYLGGKLTRTAGPVVANVLTVPVTGQAGALIRRVIGQQLPLEPAGFYTLVPKTGAEQTLFPGTAGNSKVTAIIPAGATTGYATVVDLTLDAGTTFPVTLTVNTPDQQKATFVIDK